jgi:hypothetical protein
MIWNEKKTLELKKIVRCLYYNMLKLLNYNYKNKNNEAWRKVTSSLSTDRSKIERKMKINGG